MGYWWVVKRQTKIDPEQTYVIIANHASELDIMMTLVLVKHCFVFIGKAELAKLPLFGYFYKRTNILVDRSSLASKKQVLVKAAAKLKEGIGVCIYPEGGIPHPSHLLGPFKAGAFKLAIENQLPILPISFPDNKRHFAEFWDGGFPGKLRATVHNPITTKGLTEKDISSLMGQSYKVIHDELKDYGWDGKTIYDEENASFAAS